VNGLSYAIQDEFHVLNFHSVAEDYQATLRIEEKLLRKQQFVRKGPRIWKRTAKRKTSGRR
jgi:hypothetical protein